MVPGGIQTLHFPLTKRNSFSIITSIRYLWCMGIHDGRDEWEMIATLWWLGCVCMAV